MSTYNDEKLISALLDEELGHIERQQAQAILRDSAVAEQRFKAMQALSQYMQQDRVPDLEQSETRVRKRLEYSLRGSYSRTNWWNRSVSMPLPFAAAVVVAVFAVLLYSLGPGMRVGTNGPGIASNGSAVDLRIQVDGNHTKDLLDWLDQQNTVDAVTIELPDSAQFSFQGEPVLMRASEREQFELVPFDPANDAGSAETSESQATEEETVE